MTFVWCTSERDQAKGFHTGVTGWDVPSNIGIVILGLLYGSGEFGPSLCTAVNCGEDTDCTAATVGSIFGILHGADAIPEKWITPIGRTIKTACLNLGELGYFGNQLPQSVDNLTERTEAIAHQVLARHAPGTAIVEGAASDACSVDPSSLMAGGFRETLYQQATATVFRHPFFDVAVDYCGSAEVKNGVPKPIRLSITNKHKIAATFSVHWYLPDGWSVSPSPDGVVHVKQGPWTNTKTIEYTVTADRVPAPMNRMAIELTITGRPTVILVPVTLLDGNLEG